MITLSAIKLFLTRFWKPILVAALILFVLTMFSGLFDSCGKGGIRKKAQENLNNADLHHEEVLRREGELNVREEIRGNANADVDAKRENYNQLQNKNYNGTTGEQLDRRAREYNR